MQAAPVIPLNGSTIDMSQFVTSAVDQLVNQYTGILLGTVNSYLFPALIVGLVIAGMFWLFDYPVVAMRYLWRTVIAFAVITWILRYYATPMPLIGIPFGQIFRFEGRFLSATIDISLLNVFLQKVFTAFGNAGKPNPLNIFQSIGYYLVLMTMVLPEVILFAETSFAIVALGIGALLGPVFLVLYVFPFNWTKALTWSWIHAMIKYAFYRVFASALVFIWATAEMNFITALFAGNFTLTAFMASLLGLLVFNGACFILCLRLPRLVADFTGGSASAGGGWWGSAVVAARFF